MLRSSLAVILRVECVESRKRENSLKSLGRRIVAIGDLPHEFESFQSLVHAARAPVRNVISLIVEINDIQRSPIDARRFNEQS